MNTIVFQDSILTKKGIIIKTSNADVFRESGNKRTARKEKRNGLQIVPLYIINNTADTFSITKSQTEIFINYEPAILLDKDAYYKKIKQKTGWHAIEIFIALVYYFPPTSTGISFYPLNPAGVLLPWGIYNIIEASKANKALKYDILSYDVLDKKIAPGRTFKGFICIKTKNTGNLMFRFK